MVRRLEEERRLVTLAIWSLRILIMLPLRTFQSLSITIQFSIDAGLARQFSHEEVLQCTLVLFNRVLFRRIVNVEMNNASGRLLCNLSLW